MSTSININPSDLPRVVLEQEYDATTRAALRYLRAERWAATGYRPMCGFKGRPPVRRWTELGQKWPGQLFGQFSG
jgi:hypothetical protein